MVATLWGQTSNESFRLIVTKVKKELVTIHVPPSAHSASTMKVDGFRIWAENKKSKFELTGFIPEPMSQEECTRLFKLDSCKAESLGRPEVGKEYDTIRLPSTKNILCLSEPKEPKEKVAKSDCYQIEMEEAKK
jgi:hypothetical protein